MQQATDQTHRVDGAEVERVLVEGDSFKPGLFTDMPASQYHATLALSNSGIKDLSISPLRYWHKNLSANRSVDEPTAEQTFGTAVHSFVLEGSEVFRARYARMLDQAEHPDCLATIDDLRAFLRDSGRQPKGTRKAEIIAQVQAIAPDAPIWDVLCAEHARQTEGKTLLPADVWERVLNASSALLDEPRLAAILRQGDPEVSIFGKDPATGAHTKARLDWLAPDCILDLKTFVSRRGKSIAQSVADAIYYEGYYRQAYFYAELHQQHSKASKPKRFIFAFVESEPPHEVVLRELRPTRDAHGGGMNVYWSTAKVEIRGYCQLWSSYMRNFGVKPWRRPQEIEPLEDEELRGMAFA